jgi:hypothetical protein
VTPYLDYGDALLNPSIELAVERSWRGLSKVIGPTQETAKSYQAEQTLPRPPQPVPPIFATGYSRRKSTGSAMKPRQIEAGLESTRAGDVATLEQGGVDCT